MIRIRVIACLIVLLIAGCAGFAQKTQSQPQSQTQPQTQKSQISPNAPTVPLSEAHKQFLIDTHWIISDYEKNAFVSLPSDSDRDRFIEAFWVNRDPTPGTEKNEFKDEHYIRLAYANTQFNRESALPGWQTDRGRTYILLGKPRFIRREGNPFEFTPMELWHYTNLVDYGLPGSIYLIFYQKNSIGPYRLYSPITDGIQSLYLPQTSHRNQTDAQVFDYMRRNLDPEIAHATLSAIPSESGDPTDLSRSITTEIIQAKIQNARNYDIKSRDYVDAFIHDRPTVQVYYSVGGDGVYDGVYWFQGPNGDFYVNYVIEYRPDKLDMGQFEEFYTSLTLDGQITTPDPNKVEVDEITGSHEIKLTKDQFKKVQAYPFQYQGVKPLVPGKYGLTLIITNNVSRRGITFTNELEIPDMSKATTAYLSPIMPVRAIEKAPAPDGRIRPFQFGDKIYIPNVTAKYSQQTGIQAFHQVVFPDNFTGNGQPLVVHYMVRGGDKIETEATESLNVTAQQVAGNSINIGKDIPLTGVSLGPKQLIAELKQGDTVISSAPPLSFTNETEVSTVFWKFSVAMPDYDSSYTDFTLAQQLLKLKRPQESVALLENALAQNPDSPELRLTLMRAGLRAKQFQRVLDLGTPMEVKNPRNSELNWLMGWANYGLEKYQEAATFFERMRLEDSNKVELLNILADIYYRLDQRSKSLEIVQQSLAIKPDQKDILELKKKLESKQ